MNIHVNVLKFDPFCEPRRNLLNLGKSLVQCFPNFFFADPLNEIVSLLNCQMMTSFLALHTRLSESCTCKCQSITSPTPKISRCGPSGARGPQFGKRWSSEFLSDDDSDFLVRRTPSTGNQTELEPFTKKVTRTDSFSAKSPIIF